MSTPQQRQEYQENQESQDYQPYYGLPAEDQSTLDENLHYDEDLSGEDEDPDETSQRKRQQIKDRQQPKPQQPQQDCHSNAGCGAGPRRLPGGADPRPPPAASSRSSQTRHSTQDSQSSRTRDRKSHSGRKNSEGIQGILEERQANDVDPKYKRELEEWLSEYSTWKDVTCACGHGYYTIQGEWIPGVDVRAGRAPPKPETPLPSLLMLEDEASNTISVF